MSGTSEGSIGSLLAREEAKANANSLTADLYRLLKQSAVSEFKKCRIRGGAKALHRRLSRYRMVKTLLHLDHPVDLAQFYYPTFIEGHLRRGHTVVKEVLDVDGFPITGNVLVVGYVGQGKSIFLRYLASRELNRSPGVIPLFIEMRNIRERPLTQFLLHELDLLGLDMTPTLFDYFAKNGRFLFFLDGFDEISWDEQQRVTEQAADLAQKYPNCRTIASSRPGAPITTSSAFISVRMANLPEERCREILRRLTDAKSAAMILEQLDCRTAAVTRVVKTPLMVALLVIRFKIEQTVPENEFAFFDDLFDLLVRRHDLSKRGFRKGRQSSIGDYDLRRVFNGACFLSRCRGTTDEFTLSTVHRDIAEVCDKLSINERPEKIARDIIEITNLLLEEGGHCRFIHRSIQEFHAACFVKMIGGEFAKRFYETSFDKGSWNEELRYLKHMDRINFERWLLLPTVTRWLRVGTHGPRWYQEVAGNYLRLQLLLDGYVNLGESGGDLAKAAQLANKLKKVREQVTQSINKYDKFFDEFRL